MQRRVPAVLLTLLENLLLHCYSCVKWDYLCVVSIVWINFGVRQGSVLSPFLFAVYLDNIGRPKLRSPLHGCYAIMYADDILLVSPSITRLERLLHCCEHEIASLDMCINFRRSGCLRVGPRCDIMCSTIVSSTGHAWITMEVWTPISRCVTYQIQVYEMLVRRG